VTRYAIDAPTALRLIREGSDADTRHQLVGPAVLRSHVLASIYGDVRAGRLSEAEGRDQLDALAGFKIRLLGDRVSRATAWKLASRLDRDDITTLEYLAVASLQADALITEDADLASAADGVLPIADYAALAT
jgi:predicted nucleic acid-binding protein